MEQPNTLQQTLDLLQIPAFTVRDGQITHLNAPAAGMLLSAGMATEGFLAADTAALEMLHDGCLYLPIQLNGFSFDAAAVRMDGEILFLLEESEPSPGLRALSLAAVELRKPLTDLHVLLDGIPPSEDTARMQKALYRLHRVINNMSDAEGSCCRPHLETANITFFLSELMEKAGVYVEKSGYHLEYRGLTENLYLLADRRVLERALWNLIGNAVKFSPKDSTVEIISVVEKAYLQIRVCNSGQDIAQQLRSSLFQRYLRSPGIEDPKQGLGLGMVMVRRAASYHQGTVLIDTSDGTDTRVTLTIRIQKSSGGMRSPVLMPQIDSFDTALIELSDVLPPECFL